MENDGERMTQIARDRAYGQGGVYERGLAYLFSQGVKDFTGANDVLGGHKKILIDDEGNIEFKDDEWTHPNFTVEAAQLRRILNDFIRMKTRLMGEVANEVEEFMLEMQLVIAKNIMDELDVSYPMASKHFDDFMFELEKYE